MPEIQQARLLSTLVDALRLLAATPERPDELALNFEDAFLLAPQLAETELLPFSAQELLAQINRTLARLDEQPDPGTETGVPEDADWDELRQLARAALADLSVPLAPPTLVGTTSVTDPARGASSRSRRAAAIREDASSRRPAPALLGAIVFISLGVWKLAALRAADESALGLLVGAQVALYALLGGGLLMLATVRWAWQTRSSN